MVGEAEGAGEQEARRMQGKAGAPPPLCTPAQRPTQLPTCYLLYKYFLNYQRILVSTFCAWLVSRSKGDRDRMESRTEKETKKGEKERQMERWRESDREKAGQRWGEKAEPKSVAPEQRRAEAKSHERKPGSEHPAESRGGRDRGIMTSEEPGLWEGRGEPGSEGTWGRGGQEFRGQGCGVPGVQEESHGPVGRHREAAMEITVVKGCCGAWRSQTVTGNRSWVGRPRSLGLTEDTEVRGRVLGEKGAFWAQGLRCQAELGPEQELEGH